MGYDRAQLKRDVKLSMKYTSSRPMMTTLMFTVVVSAGSWLLNTVLGGLLTGGVGSISNTFMAYYNQGHELEEALYITMLELFRMGPGAIFGAIVGGTVLSVLVTLWQSSMEVGYESWCLSMVRSENPPMNQIFDALPRFGPVLVTRFLTGVFEVLWSLLAMAYYAVFVAVAVAVNHPVLSSIIALLGVITGLLGLVWVTMRYSLVDYLLLDKGLTGMDAIRESRRLMKERTKDGFVLKLSFIGWYLLVLAIIYGAVFAVLMLFGAGLSSIGVDSVDGLVAASGISLLLIIVAAIGVTVLMLWLRPYITGSMARFYDFTQGRRDVIPGASGFGGGSDGWSEHTDYTWNAGSGSGTGMGPGPRNDDPPPKPRKPRDDPWD